MAAAHSSIGTEAWFENTIGTPCSAAAWATARSASECASSSTPTGPSSSGAGSVRPSNGAVRFRGPTPASIRGTNAQRSNAARLARIVDSPPAPPAR